MTTQDRLPWRILVPAVLAPNVFYATGRGAIVPTIPLLAVHMGGSLATAALVAALLTVGELTMTLPASWMVVRFGENNTMLLGAAATIAGALCAMFAPSLAILGLGVLLIGLAGSVYLVARQAWVAITIPNHQRGRAFALVAGSQRTGMLTGPLLTAAVLGFTDDPRWTFGIAVACGIAVVVVLTVWPTPPEPQNGGGPVDEGGPGVLRTMWDRRDVLMRLGMATSLLSSMRAVRQVLVPLWGAGLGLSAAQISLIVALGAAIDVVLFYSGGHITDKYGRLWVAVPTMLGFAVANLGLALSSQFSGQVAVYIAMSLLMALANSISSGVNATMGADLADPRRPAVFLGSWRMVNETGSAAVPLLLSSVTAVMSLSTAVAVTGVVGLVGAAAMYRYIKRFLPPTLQ